MNKWLAKFATVHIPGIYVKMPNTVCANPEARHNMENILKYLFVNTTSVDLLCLISFCRITKLHIAPMELNEILEIHSLACMVS